jgi:hypothetical protein
MAKGPLSADSGEVQIKNIETKRIIFFIFSPFIFVSITTIMKKSEVSLSFFVYKHT